MDEGSFSPNKIISYGAPPGERNVVTVELVGTNYIVTDTGATSSIPDADGPGGCQQVSPTQYSCPETNLQPGCFDRFAPDLRDIRRIRIAVADLSDRVTVSASIDSVVFGGTGNDVLNGGACADWIEGGPSNGEAQDDDYIDAGNGGDHLEGGIGDDEMHPGLGDDLLGLPFGIVGGLGTDTVSYSERTTPVKVDISDAVGQGGSTAAPCTLNLSDVFTEFDTIDRTPGTAVENVVGTTANDCIVGSRFANTIRGGLGADLLSGEQGNDTVDYSERTNPVRVSLGDGPNDGEAGEGDDVIDDVENIVGGAGDDTLIGQNRVAPTSGLNARGGQEGVNRLSGGPGNDLLEGKADSDSFEGDAGFDIVTYQGRATSLVGSIDDGANDDGGAEDVNDLTHRGDTILAGVEGVVGGEGNDVLRGDGTANFLNGGGGEDRINGGGGNDEINGGAGNDPALAGSSGNDTVRGGAGLDNLEGGDGNDTLDGGENEDLLDGGTGADAISGGPGGDAADYSSRLGPVLASADGVAGDGEKDIDPSQPGDQTEGDTIASDVEDLLGGIDDDTLVGNSAQGFIDGGGGDDLLDGGGGRDDLVGGAGTDRVTYAGRTAPVTVDLTTFGGDGEAGEDDEIFDDVEKVNGGAGNDTIVGDGAGNILHGEAGADNINGGDGFDLIHGDRGNDNLNGAGGTDQVYGDDGNDALLGDSDADTLHGGANDDSLDGGTGADILNGNQGTDTANYASRTSAVTITLDGVPNDGQSRENDLVKKDVESVSTGSGNDNINSADQQTGRVSCGRGRDTIDGRDASDTIAADCESVGALNVCSVRTARGGRMSRSGVVRLRVNCPSAGRTSVTLRRGKARIGSKRFSVRKGKVKTVKVKLSRKGRRAVKRARRNRLRVRATLAPVRSGKVRITRTSRRTITIRAPR